MSRDLTGQVAVVTGAGRGQGRSHALRLAEQGADIIALDIGEQMPNVLNPLATPEDLAETAEGIRALGRKVHAAPADVRDLDALTAAVTEGQARLGNPVSIVIANAGIGGTGSMRRDLAPEVMFRDVIDVNLTGVWATLHATAPLIIEGGRGGAIVLTSSTQGLSGRGGNGSPGTSAYTAAKHGVVGLMRAFAWWLAPHHIRVNSIHPTGVDTPMINSNAAREEWMQSDPEAARSAEAMITNLMPVSVLQPGDISDAILWLVSDEAKYVTGVTLPVDAGFGIK